MIKPDELPGFLRTLNTADIHTTTKLAMQFVILTAARTSEVREAKWAEIDFDKCLWSIPGERMKMKVPHTVPLSKAALAILNRVKILYGEKKYIFPGIRDQGQPLSQNTMLFAMYRMGYHTRATVHGFRGLFSTIANESGINPDAIERQLAHGEKDATRAAYNRAEYLEERREIMEWYGDYIERCIIEGEAESQAD
jgi:integrase